MDLDLDLDLDSIISSDNSAWSYIYHHGRLPSKLSTMKNQGKIKMVNFPSINKYLPRSITNWSLSNPDYLCACRYNVENGPTVEIGTRNQNTVEFGF